MVGTKAGEGEASDPDPNTDPSDEDSAISIRLRELSGFNEWLKAGLALHRLGACVGLNEALVLAAKDQHIKLLNKAKERQTTTLECTCKLATYDPAASCETCKTIAQVLTDEHEAAPGKPPLAWVNSNSRLWLHPEAGALEISKLYAGALGPSFVPRSITNVQGLSIRAKLSILASSPYLRGDADRRVVAAALTGLETWAEDPTLSLGEVEAEQGRVLIQGVLTALHAVLGSAEGRQRVVNTLETCGIISQCPDVLNSYGPQVVEAVLGLAVSPHCLRILEGGEDGVREAEAALMALDKRVRHFVPELQGLVKRARERVDKELKIQQDVYEALLRRAEGKGGQEGEEEEGAGRSTASLEAKYHTGIREEVGGKLEGIRRALDKGDHKEALRLGLPLLLTGKDLQVGELHVLHEYLAWAYRGQERLPQALASINKALGVGGGEEGFYCPLALRIKWRLLERLEDGTEDGGTQRALMEESLSTIDKIRDEDRTPADQSRWAALHVNLCYHKLRDLRRVSQSASTISESGELPVRSRLAAEGVERLHKLTAAFEEEKPSVAEQPFLYVNVQRLLGMFFADPSMKVVYRDHLDRAIQCYREVVHTVVYHKLVHGKVTQETENLLTYRLELAKLHLQRGDEGRRDEISALQLFEACFETACEPAEVVNICRYRAELLQQRGERLDSEEDLRAAIDDYQTCLEQLESHRELKERHQTEISHFNRALGYLYGTVANVLIARVGGHGDLDSAPPTPHVHVHVHGEEGGCCSHHHEWGPDQEKAINHLLAAHDGFRRSEDGNLDAGMAAMQLGRMYRTRVKERRKKNVEKAIEWFQKADSMFREGGVGGGDLATRKGIAEMVQSLCESLAELYEERTSGEKKDNRKRAEKYAARAELEGRRLESLLKAAEREADA